MNYETLINNNIKSVYQSGIAAKILQHMDRIRNVSDLTQARRWVMELFQNSRDVSYGDQPVRIRIELTQDKVTFSHNGRPFRVKDILSIINQVSSKTGEDHAIGQFGTGFMTTYQLSEMVEIQGVLKDFAEKDGETKELPYTPFSVSMDRRGTTREEILDGISEALEELKKNCGGDAGYDFDREAFNTRFLYHLDNEDSRRIAQTGIEDLQHTIHYILLFSEKIGSVELVRNMEGCSLSVLFKRGEEEELGNGLKRLSITESSREGGQEQVKTHYLVSLREGDLTAAAAWGPEGFLPISEKTPRLFVDLPLVGSEEFPFPVILNCQNFRPNEPRSNITLVDNLSSRDALVNKEIMDRAVGLYGRFLHELWEMGFGRLDRITAIPVWKPDREMSEAWVKEHLYGQLFRIVSSQPLIDTREGKTEFCHGDLYLIKGDSQEELKGLVQLLEVLEPMRIPMGDEDWNRAFAGYEAPESKYLWIGKVVDQSRRYLQSMLNEEKMPALMWCGLLFRTAMKNQDLAAGIRAGDVCIFPNQNKKDWEERRLFTIRQIKRDQGIPEILKEVSDVLDQLEGQKEEKLSIRCGLLHAEFDLQGLCQVEDFDLGRLYSHILTRTNRKFPVRGFMDYGKMYEAVWHQAWKMMVSCGADKKLYDVCRVIYGDGLRPWKPLGDERFHESMWKNSGIHLLGRVEAKVRDAGSLDGLKAQVCRGMDRQQLYQWLTAFYDRAFFYAGEGNVKDWRVFPDQKGNFKALRQLMEDGTPGEELKGIAGEFSAMDRECDVYEYVLDRNVSVKGGVGIGVLREPDVAAKINQVVLRLLSMGNLSDAAAQYQEACTRLLGWIQENPQTAARYFPAFTKEEDQMRLLTPKAAVRIQRKARDFQVMLETLGADTVEEAIKRLEQFEKEAAGKEADPGEEKWNDVVWDKELLRELDLLGEDERGRVCREIGMAGERYVMEKVREYFLAKGYERELEHDGEIRLLEQAEESEGSRRRVTIVRPDAGGVCQSGWDICVTISRGQEKEEYYLEVKTHTSRSVVKGELFLSNEQMKAAVRNGQQYVVVSVVYDYRARQGKSLTAYKDPLGQIVKGAMVNQYKGYAFYACGNETEG